MANKKEGLNSKLGSWTDQANLSREQGDPTPKRDTYLLQRSLIERINDVAAQNDLTHHQLVGHLLTWALDQVETGQYVVPKSGK